MDKKIKNFIFWTFAALICCNILAWTAVFDLARPQYLEVTFFDVGQGDAIFIETPQQNQILIDGGPDASVLEKLGKEMLFWDRTIDLIILTHPEQDHIAGLLEVLKHYRVKNVMWTGVVRDIAEYKEWLRLLKQEEANVIFTKAGQKITCLECRRQVWELLVLFPFEGLRGEETMQSNNTSVVTKLMSARVEFLFTGDIEESVEQELILRDVSLKSDVLKVAHHGSKTSSISDFVAAVSPTFAVISAGRNNRYGHPHLQTLETLRRYNSDILRTDIDGDIKFITDGKSIQVNPVRKLHSF